jgi:hypothetical protein
MSSIQEALSGRMAVAARTPPLRPAQPPSMNNAQPNRRRRILSSSISASDPRGSLRALLRPPDRSPPARDYFRFAQMLANGGHLDGTRILGRKALALMHANPLPAALLPLDIGGLPLPGYGFGLGSRVALDAAQTGAPGSVGEFGWSGAAKTHYWADPQEGLVGLFMTQSMMSFDLTEFDLRALAYQAIED